MAFEAKTGNIKETGDGADILLAQLALLHRQVPPLYALLSVNAAALAFTHRDIAPALLTLFIPAMLILASMLRMIRWMLPLDRELLSAARLRARMRRVTLVGAVFSLGYVSWALMLDQYGGPYEQSHVAIFVAVTILGCIFCLTHLPSAARLITITVVGSFLAHSFWIGTELRIAIAINIALVASVILKVVKDSFSSFLDLEASKVALSKERRQAQALSEENARLAHTDPLTMLPNRRYFFAHLEKMLASGAVEGEFCVGVLDLDRFKPINDSYGHAQGDKLLQTLGERMRALCNSDVQVVRLGGDEFGLIVNGDLDAAGRVGDELCRQIHKPVQLGDTTVSVGSSGGIASFPEAGRTAHDLFDRADFALYHAKKHKRGKFVKFSADLEDMIRSDLALDAALQSADLAQELSMAFQPIISTVDQKVVACEALARWTSPKLGVIAPEKLIATAERIGIAQSLTLALFDRVLALSDRLPPSVWLSFNLSAADIGDSGTVTALIDRMRKAGMARGRIAFEITETSLIIDMSNARVSLERLRAAGATIALDDFGTGYSSLSSLHQLPLDIVKIDRSFAARLDDPSGRRLLDSIRNLALSLSLQCVIEGIETEGQMTNATLTGFQFAQGYFIAKPDTIDAASEFCVVREHAAADAA